MEIQTNPPVQLEGFREAMRAADLEEIVEVTIEVYVDEAPRTFDLLSAGVAEGNLDVVNSCAHSLKSSSHNVWAKAVAEMFGIMEDAARDNDPALVNSTFAEAEPEFRRVMDFLCATLAA
jgi:HPt (histidine-containing phosphotransfer) domain-containing protein